MAPGSIPATPRGSLLLSLPSPIMSKTRPCHQRETTVPSPPTTMGLLPQAPTPPPLLHPPPLHVRASARDQYASPCQLPLGGSSWFAAPYRHATDATSWEERGSNVEGKMRRRRLQQISHPRSASDVRIFTMEGSIYPSTWLDLIS